MTYIKDARELLLRCYKSLAWLDAASCLRIDLDEFLKRPVPADHTQQPHQLSLPF